MMILHLWSRILKGQSFIQNKVQNLDFDLTSHKLGCPDLSTIDYIWLRYNYLLRKSKFSYSN